MTACPESLKDSKEVVPSTRAKILRFLDVLDDEFLPLDKVRARRRVGLAVLSG
jgi:hypothetical protein